MRQRSCIAAAILCVVGSTGALAQTITWVGPLNGVTSDAANWSGGVPGTSVTAIFNNAVSTVVFDGPVPAYNEFFENGVTTLEMNHYTLGGGSGGGSGLLGVTSTTSYPPSHASLIVRNGAINAGSVSVGRSTNAVGDITLLAGASLQTGAVRLGDGSAATGRIALSGIGATLSCSSGLTLGLQSGSSGELTLDSGATVQSSAGVFIGSTTNSYGSVALHDAGTRLNTAMMRVGDLGTGSLRVDRGAWLSLTNQLETTTQTSGGSASIAIDNATVVSGYFALSAVTAASLTNGAIVTANSGTTDSTNNGTLTIDNSTISLSSARRLNNSGTIYANGRLAGGFSNSATGRILVNSGQSLLVDNGTTVNSNSGIIAVTGGSLNLVRGIDNSSNGLITARDAILRFGDGSTSNRYFASSGQLVMLGGNNTIFGDVNLLSSAKIAHSGNSVTTYYDDVANNTTIFTDTGSKAYYLGSVSGGGTFTGAGESVFLGDMRPGNSPGTLTFNGPVTFAPGSTIDIELAGTTSAEFDHMQAHARVTGDVRLSIGTYNGFTPLPGMRFDKVLANDVNVFDLSSLIAANATPFAGLSFAVEMTESKDAVGVIVHGTPGDANLDAAVNFDDLLTLAQHYGQATGQSWLTGDFTGDAAVGFEDLLSLAQNYASGALTDSQREAVGRSIASDWTLAQTLVPEPTAGLMLLAVRRRHRRPR